MKRTMKIFAWVIGVMALIMPILLWNSGQNVLRPILPVILPIFRIKPTPSIQPERTLISIGTARITAEVARTPLAREQGLSGRDALLPDTGLLFMFDTPDNYSFWMKDMNFSIDIIWMGSDMRIVDLTESALPESYPTTFTSRVPSQYVLEVPAGTVKKQNFHIGDAALLLPLQNP